MGLSMIEDASMLSCDCASVFRMFHITLRVFCSNMWWRKAIRSLCSSFWFITLCSLQNGRALRERNAPGPTPRWRTSTPRKTSWDSQWSSLGALQVSLVLVFLKIIFRKFYIDFGFLKGTFLGLLYIFRLLKQVPVVETSYEPSHSLTNWVFWISSWPLQRKYATLCNIDQFNNPSLVGL